AGAVAGGIRVTEQGEVVASKYGHPDVGRRTLERMLAAALLADVDPEPDAADGAQAASFSTFSSEAYRAYRALVYETPGFEPYFRTLISNLEMVLAKSNLEMARRYADLVEDQDLANGIFERIAAEWTRTRVWVVAITGQKALLEHDPALADSIRLRLPYIDAL